MKIFVGLGNPLEQYAQTRHNMGEIILQRLTSHFGYGPYRFDKKINGYVCENIKIDNQKITAILPQTYMNLSGTCIKLAAKYWEFQIEDIVVFHDESELKPGEISYKFDGGHRGHNGLRNLSEQLGGANFHRIRLGVGRPENRNFSLADYLLSKIPAADYPDTDRVISLLKEHKIF